LLLQILDNPFQERGVELLLVWSNEVGEELIGFSGQMRLVKSSLDLVTKLSQRLNESFCGSEIIFKSIM